MNFRSPLGRVLGSGSAKDGTHHFWVQRLSAVGLLILGAWFLYSFSQLPGFAYPDIVQWAGQPLNSVLLILLVLTLAWHSSLGVQVIVEDYVHGNSLRVLSLILIQFAHVFVALAAVYAVLKISFGAQV